MLDAFQYIFSYEQQQGRFRFISLLCCVPFPRCITYLFPKLNWKEQKENQNKEAEEKRFCGSTHCILMHQLGIFVGFNLFHIPISKEIFNLFPLKIKLNGHFKNTTNDIIKKPIIYDDFIFLTPPYSLFNGGV